MIVIDASIAAVWLYDDESEILADVALDILSSEGAFAPLLWRYEIRNLLLMGVRRRRIDQDMAEERLKAVETLPVVIDQEANLNIALQFAHTYELSFYDALYLELADRLNAKLVTLDKALLGAAQAENIAFSYPNQNM